MQFSVFDSNSHNQKRDELAPYSSCYTIESLINLAFEGNKESLSTVPKNTNIGEEGAHMRAL